MKLQHVEVVAPISLSTFFPSPGKFTYNPEGRFPWLQKALFWCLQRLDCQAKTEKVKIERHVIDGVDFLGRLWKQCETLENYLGRRPSRIYIGSEDFAKLMDESEPPSLRFCFQARYYNNDTRSIGTVFDVPVEVLPTMRGTLVVP